jgi:transcriptional regulator with XRE-family HTH domain
MTTAAFTVRGIPYLRTVGIPTREAHWGVELKSLRKALGLPLATLGKELGVSDVTVLNWEKAEDKRLGLTTEVAMHAFFAERFGVPSSGTLTALRGTAKAPEDPVDLPAAS